MKTYPLTEYLKNHSNQPELALALGITQSAVSQMARSGRNITVTVHEDGTVEAQEVRPIPARPRSAEQAA